MDKFLFLVLVVLTLAIPVNAADLNGGVVDDGTAESSDPAAPSAEAAAETEESEAGIAALAGSDTLTGGYYFVCDCALGYDLKFYVPTEWACDNFTLDTSGAPVNLSNTTCYAYCPDFPDYTFSCARFAGFTYRSSNYSSVDLNITEISETNINFLEDTPTRLSDWDQNTAICSLLFLVAAILIIKRS